MDKKILKRKKTTAAELPEDLVRREILTLLPIKSVARFKCVSKSWLSLFSDSKFVKQHLTRNTTRNPDDHDRVIASKNNEIVILSRYKETLALPYEFIELVGSIGGLVCLRSGSNISLWNPAIHQSKEFTFRPNHTSHCVQVLEFGFDPLTGDGTKIRGCLYWEFTTFARDEDGYVTFSTATSLSPVKFDIGSNDFKLLSEFHFGTSVKGDTDAFRSNFRYAPSLVFLDGMKSVFLPTHSRRKTDLCSSVPRRLINSLNNRSFEQGHSAV
ncbi:putative F-box protein At3g25550 [Apium graveolens]|uniref:putative F-box protein At3g25550 n=1 Tax=Apium graveolens TaxID=4045 RepID=UPI003D7BACCE